MRFTIPKIRRPQGKTIVLTLAASSFLFIFSGTQNCSNANLIPLSSPSAAPAAAAVQPRPQFGDLQAVLAVRNTACLLCHAQIEGDLISDFGYGNPFFMGIDSLNNHPEQPYYGPFASKHFIWQKEMWQGSSIMGNVYVPNQTIGDVRLIDAYKAGGNLPLTGPLKVLDFVKGKFINTYVSATAPTEIIGRSSSTDVTVPGLRGNFYSRDTIWIDSPSADEIRTLKNGLYAQLAFAELGVEVYRASEEAVITGLIAKKSSTNFKLYLSNDSTMTCKGDIILEGVLFLDNLKLDTDAAGCRLYVTGTVFIQGPITYLNGGDSNLQITSSRAIIMGMRGLSARLTMNHTTAAVSGIRTAWTDEQELNSNIPIFNDRDIVDGLTNDAGPFYLMGDLTGKVVAIMDDPDLEQWAPAQGVATYPDPSNCSVDVEPTGSQTCAIVSSGLHPTPTLYRRTVNYTHLMLNAPKIHSRYYGTFQGVIIGEDVIFAVNNFVFHKDPVLLKTRLLPLVAERIFHMSDN